MGPVLPFLSDSPAQLDESVRLIAQAGASSITPIVLHLRPGAREWFFAWLARQHPALVGQYRQLYGAGAYAPKAYQARISAAVTELARKYGIGRATPTAARRLPPPPNPASTSSASPSPVGRSPASTSPASKSVRPASQHPSHRSSPDGVQLTLL
jgi:hypothetical protein